MAHRTTSATTPTAGTTAPITNNGRPPQRRVFPRAKVVATIGPSSNTPERIRWLISSGLDVARINFSHGTHEEHARVIGDLRRVAAELGRPVAILGDLQGPRIRIGKLSAPRELEENQEIILAPDDEAAGDEIPVTFHKLAKDVTPGKRILINDGLIEVAVRQIIGRKVKCQVLFGGTLSSNKGMNLPGVRVSTPSITDKDKADLAFAVEHDLDAIALSFVRSAEDIHELRSMIPSHMMVVAKIEKDVALDNMEEILVATDAVMVARGDLGVELPFEEVPIAQKRIIALANQHGRPVITATQMLESMVHHPRPTRAEASDVANAILDGTDAVMLSAETAAGQYPRMSLEAMKRIILEVETTRGTINCATRSTRTTEPVKTEVAIAAATTAAVDMLKAPLVIVFTKSGFSARVISSHRPSVPILCLTDDPRVCRQLSMVWGVIPRLVPTARGYDHMVAMAMREAQELQLVFPGDRVVVTAGAPFDVPGTTNLLKVEVV